MLGVWRWKGKNRRTEGEMKMEKVEMEDKRAKPEGKNTTHG